MAHATWREHLRPTDHVVDATCGRGRDTEVLASWVPEGHVYALDLQMEAIASTQARVASSHVSFHCQCHTQPPPSLTLPLSLVVYNLGYLPGGDHSVTTKLDSTLVSVQKFLSLLSPGGMISVTCYPGHPAGAEEEAGLAAWVSVLCPMEYPSTWQRWGDRSPSLLLIRNNRTMSG